MSLFQSVTVTWTDAWGFPREVHHSTLKSFADLRRGCSSRAAARCHLRAACAAGRLAEVQWLVARYALADPALISDAWLEALFGGHADVAHLKRVVAKKYGWRGKPLCGRAAAAHGGQAH